MKLEIPGRDKHPRQMSPIMMPIQVREFDPRFDIPAQYGDPELLWVAGDGNTPTIGPAFTLTGTPSIEGTIEIYDPGEYRVGSSTIAAGASDVIVAFAGRTPDDVAANSYLFADRLSSGSQQGWRLLTYNNNLDFTAITVTPDSAGVIVITGVGTRVVFGAVFAIDRDGRVYSHYNGVQAQSGSTLDGAAIDTGQGVGLGCRHDGAFTTEERGVSIAVIYHEPVDTWIADGGRKALTLAGQIQRYAEQ